jgi:hypothetical protein
MARIAGSLIKVVSRTLVLIWAIFPSILLGLAILAIFLGICSPLELNLFR